MADYLTTDTELTSVANAIRTKGGTSAQLVYPTGFVSAIQAIPTGGGSAKTCTLTIIDSDVTCSNFSGSAPSGTYVAIAELHVVEPYGSCLGVFIGTEGTTSLSEATNSYNAMFAMNEPQTPGIMGYMFSQNAFVWVNDSDYGGDNDSSLLSAYAGTYTATVIEF